MGILRGKGSIAIAFSCFYMGMLREWDPTAIAFSCFHMGMLRERVNITVIWDPLVLVALAMAHCTCDQQRDCGYDRSVLANS